MTYFELPAKPEVLTDEKCRSAVYAADRFLHYWQGYGTEQDLFLNHILIYSEHGI